MDDDKEKKEEEKLDAAGKKVYNYNTIEVDFFSKKYKCDEDSFDGGCKDYLLSSFCLCEFISIITKIEERKYKVLI